MNKKISIIVPVFNEEENIFSFYEKIKAVLNTILFEHEIFFVNDGSTDETSQMLHKLSQSDPAVKIIEFSRNFGKEIAMTAGLNHARGDAALLIDADLQHPPELIPEFLEKWNNGAEVVVGIRRKNHGEGFVKRMGSYFFYKLINNISDIPITPNATDYRLLDRIVLDEFNRLTEQNRMTRGLIDWLGFRREYVHFEAPPRAGGKAAYSYIKLTRLAFNSIVSLSLLPLRLAGYLGIIIMIFSGGLGLFIIIGKYVFQNSLALGFSGPAQLAILIVFLVGVILSCLGLIALYIAHIHKEVIDRPMYVIRRKNFEV